MVRSLDAVPGRCGSARGAALVIALMATVVLTALGASVVLVTSTETMIAANYRTAVEAHYAADAVIERALQDLRRAGDWDDVLGGRLESSFSGGAPPRLSDGTVLDLAAETAGLQAETDAANLWAANNPAWRLYAYGSVNSLVPGVDLHSPMYVAVWVADDPSDVDGDPQADANGMVILHARAYGPGGTRNDVQATVARPPDTGGLRVVSWRELR